jgi:hypothetical protein
VRCKRQIETPLNFIFQQKLGKKISNVNLIHFGLSFFQKFAKFLLSQKWKEMKKKEKKGSML